MKQIVSVTLLITVVFLCTTSFTDTDTSKKKPFDDNAKLQREIEYMDSIFFGAYNTCNLAVADSILSDNIEFYHDQGGLETSKKSLMEALKKNICGKVTRELKKGSIEVYPIPGYGAVQMGMHGFHNNQEKETGPTRFAKFVHLWKKENGKWRITRVISLH